MIFNFSKHQDRPNFRNFAAAFRTCRMGVFNKKPKTQYGIFFLPFSAGLKNTPLCPFGEIEQQAAFLSNNINRKKYGTEGISTHAAN